ncbi:UNVERIFIED_CONTAM: Proteasome subunit beta type-4 [Gekko kuhli]
MAPPSRQETIPPAQGSISGAALGQSHTQDGAGSTALRGASRTPDFRSPMVTGTSVLGVKFDGGVIIAADMLGSYGSLARFRNISRVMKVNDSTVLGASGDYADFQYLKQVIDQMVKGGSSDTSKKRKRKRKARWLPFSRIDEELLGDGHSYSPKAIHSWLTRAMYSRRSKMNPLWNTVVIGGYANGEG